MKWFHIPELHLFKILDTRYMMPFDKLSSSLSDLGLQQVQSRQVDDRAGRITDFNIYSLSVFFASSYANEMRGSRSSGLIVFSR
jgi:hypothetical protein